MANEAFALSPISARAASPTDADFEAIREAFLETARGRWFLDEYTRRNRNTDTAMVLEAVARIESSLAAQKEEQRQQAAVEIPPVEPPSNELPEAMAAVRAIVAAARESVSASLSGSVFEESLAPSRKCARVIREIAWGLRESGADGRICFLLESQVDAINAACDHVAAGGIRDGVLQAFDEAVREIEAIAPSTIEPQSEAESVAALHVADTAPIEASDEVQIAAADEELFDVAAVSEASSPEMTTEAVLPVEESLPVLAIPAEPIEASEPAMALQLEIPPEAPEPVLEIIPEIAMTAPASLGESLIASGIIARPATPRSDPLAPIRRMSQAEKVAFFS